MFLHGFFDSLEYYGRSYRELARLEKRTTPAEYGMYIQGKHKKKKKKSGKKK